MTLEKQFLCKWRIVSMEQWDNDYIKESCSLDEPWVARLMRLAKRYDNFMHNSHFFAGY